MFQADDDTQGFPSVDRNGVQWKKVDTVASGEEVRVETISIGPVFTRGLYLAFQDTGSCMQLMHVKVSYAFCPAIVAEFGSFPMTHTGSSASSIINQKGKCVLNSVSSGPQKNPSFHCGADGKWILNSKSCQCRPGFKSNFDRTQCSPCPTGTYKNNEGIGNCSACPLNSQSSGGAAECRCFDGYFRSDPDSVIENCEALPDRVKNVKTNRTETTLLVEWDPPTGFSRFGSSIQYRIKCYICSGREDCEICPSSVSQPNNLLSETKILIANISPTRDYKLHIKPESSITERARQYGYDSEPVEILSKRVIKEVLKIESIEILEVSSKTAKFRLSLAQGSPKFSGIEISLSGDGLDVKREMRLGLKIFDLDLLQPQTSYTMRVRVTDGARGHQMISDWSDVIYFRTAEEVESKLLPSIRQESNQWLAGVITGAILLVVCLIVVALIVWRRKSDGNQWMKGTRASIEQFSVVTSSSAAQNGTMNGTVDLIPCSHPASISAENCVEISASNLNISATIKTGRLGKVSFGTLYKRPVAVKQLLMTNEEYLQDMKCLNQLEHNNVMQIEGFVTGKYPTLIVMERMDSNLSEFLQQQPSTNALTIFRDLTNGLLFLHSNRIVLRHFDLSHVMVAQLTLPTKFKIRMSSKYETEPIIDDMSDARYNNYISVRQVAPECFGTSNRFTAESDIWSFGILMWAVCSANLEEPYWGLTIRQVVEAVTSGWRLPLPAAESAPSPKDCEQNVHRLMLQCWEQNPEARPNAKELRYKIEQMIQSSPESSPGIAV